MPEIMVYLDLTIALSSDQTDKGSTSLVLSPTSRELSLYLSLYHIFNISQAGRTTTGMIISCLYKHVVFGVGGKDAKPNREGEFQV